MSDGLKDLGFRSYNVASSRFPSVDPLTELQLEQSPYQYAGNNPVNKIGILGLDAETETDADAAEVNTKVTGSPPKKPVKGKVGRRKMKSGYAKPLRVLLKT